MQSDDKRKTSRVVFSHRIDAKIVATDGTWTRACSIEDVAQSGAKLTVQGSIAGLSLKQFFLVLSSTGSAHRCCELVWTNGNQLGVRFIESFPKQKSKSKRGRENAGLRHYEI